MNYKEQNEILSDYLIEYIERITRFYQHIDEVKDQFYPEADISNFKSDGHILFIESYKACLIKLFCTAVGYFKILDTKKSETDISEILIQISDSIEIINKFHTNQLIHLPRPKTPIELQRFSRMIDKQINNAKEKLLGKNNHDNDKQTSIFVTEETFEQTDIPHPLAEFEVIEINTRIQDYNTIKFLKFPKIDEFKLDSEYNKNYIRIPRIETNNPCRWPTLIHELSHHIYPLFFNDTNIEESFNNECDPYQKELTLKIIDENNISLLGWLKECWCDLIATFIIGPSFWFAQFSTFIMNRKCIRLEKNSPIKSTHPTALFRLKLIKRIIDHRIFDNTRDTSLEININSASRIIEYFDKNEDNGFENNDDIKQLYIIFKDYFFKLFLKNNKEVIEKLDPLVKYTFNINSEYINKHIEDIKNGRPIPSTQKFSDIKVIETPASIQDIILAAWIYRRSIFKLRIYKYINDIDTSFTEHQIREHFCENILPEFLKFDQIILRSIQVSEWFDFYDPFNEPIKLTKDAIKSRIDKYEDVQEDGVDYKLLTDRNIYTHLKSGDLKIIPLINLKDQLGTSSLDVRLGTSFQIYFPNRIGIVDFTNAESINSYYISSQLFDLDFKESITIAPQHFMLGHSMEYIELPDYLSAEVEGRSSFARLGLEIHVTAGFIDPGFTGVITFELYNSGPNPIKLFPGLRIAQLRFIKVDEPAFKYRVKESTKYKGLLAHKISLQFKDMEIERLQLINQLKGE